MNRSTVVNAEDWLLMLPVRASERVEPHLLEWFAGEREALEAAVLRLVSDLGWWDTRWDDYRPVYWLALVAHWRSVGAIDDLLRLLRGSRVFGGWVIESAVVRIASEDEGVRLRIVRGLCEVMEGGLEDEGGFRRVVRLLGVLVSGWERVEELRRTMSGSGARAVREEAARWLAAVGDLWSWPTMCRVVREEAHRELWEVMMGTRTLLDGWVMENSPLGNV